MKSRPIIFRGDMVRAIREGRKTQTRRVVTLREFDRSGTPGYDWTFRDRRGVWNDYDNAHLLARQCPYGVPGDELWVRETWCFEADPITSRTTERVLYKATDQCDFLDDGDGSAVLNKDGSERSPWRSPLFMPREASRLTLVVRSVRVERLSEITNADARAEGFTGGLGTDEYEAVPPACEYRDAFRQMHKLHADADPWLWVVTFGVKP